MIQDMAALTSTENIRNLLCDVHMVLVLEFMLALFTCFSKGEGLIKD